MITVVGNLKGGTGKSTVTFNLAIWLALNDHEVELFDLDPQATLSDVGDIREEDEYEPLILISNSLDELENSNKEEILIDIGTADTKSMKKAIALTDRIIVPVPPSQADIWSTQRFIKMVLDIRGKKNMPQMLGFVNRADTHKGVRETGEAEDALKMLPHIDFIDTRLYQRTTYRRSFSEGLAVFELEPKGKAAAEVNKFASIVYPDK
ncbi:MAG: AAA family ATPase [gamma proteobacterium symbiont of Bathyaustriella thionipta]|nr:AAA family ATPase [gamma proteobacterium symbiont of Bathyaustriella thionipta]MCU7949299.1 AAA family ATPase [gamma proteobacterium symbiont of Bathyaustriella thionipta]MCU7954465.1 AAA family ATPase [gamma proteobacterium symbiont of Bathyaustriella thionipta]MCU7956062.1 AAA family ATPase [gamma proteobacterium symbiont of Bathyaustriella thionipta]MCU7968480.1 AAA family ATPase [gamma proteobacterium symbiont of Bathyaustriella thionipta]